MAVSIVIPCYRSERSIELLVDKLATLPLTIEVILVDDESPDGTWEAIGRCCQKHDFVTGYSLARNVGQHNALLVGIRKARYSTIVTMDDDLQYDPADIPKMVSALEEGADLVYGVPMQDRQSWLRRLTSRASKYVFERALNMPNTENSSSFRAFSENGQKALRAF